MKINPIPGFTTASIPASRLPRRVYWLVTAAIAAVSSGAAVLQEPRPDPFTSPAFLSADWWKYPRERNAFKRVPALTARLNGVYALRGSDQVWAVGNGGLLIRSDDGGRTWRQDSIVATGAGPGKKAPWDSVDVSQGPGAMAPDVKQDNVTIDTSSSTETPPYAQSKAPNPARGKGSPRAAAKQGDSMPAGDDLGSLQAAPGRLRHNFHNVYFATPLRGWVVGAGGLVAHTADGGESWNVNWVEGAGDIVAAGFGLESAGVVIDHTGASFETENGITWERMEYSLRSMSVFSPHLGYVVTYRGAIVLAEDDELDSPRAREAGRFREISFIDSLRGWATDSTGGMWTTTDAGGRWDSLPGQTMPLPGKISFSDTRTGWTVSAGGHLLRTGDGGREWTHVLGRLRLNAAAFANRDDGWAVGERGTLLETGDGGESWKSRRLGTERDLVAIRFSGRDAGLVADASGGFWRTTDGGRTWEPDTLATPLPGAPIEPRSISISDVDEVMATVDGVMYRRLIGEPSWRAYKPQGVDDLVSLAYFDSRRASGTTRGGELYYTQDGGAGWALSERRLPATPYAVLVTDTIRLWILGTDGRVLRSSNYGVNWALDQSATRHRLRSASFFEDSLAVGVSAAGTVLMSRDAGRTWNDPARPARSPAPWYGLALVVVLILVLSIRAPAPVEPPPSVADLLVSDRPIRKGDRDPLDFTSVALGLSRFIRNARTEPPLTIAITGKWGTGKSSLMNLLQDDLRQYGFRPIWFNAWHHQKEEHLLASLLHKVQQEAAPPILHPGGLMFRARLLWIRARRFRTVMLLMVLLFVASVGYLASDFQEQPQRVLHGAVDLVRKVVPAEDAAATAQLDSTAHTRHGPARKEAEQGSLLAFLLLLVSSGTTIWKGLRTFGGVPASLLTTMRGAFRLRDLKAQTGFRSQFETEFQEVTEALGSRAMVILVDDLDRCRPENVLEVLEAINFLVSSGRCFVLLGMDRNFVEGCVGLGFKHVAEELAFGEGAPLDRRRAGAAESGNGAKAGGDREREIRRDFAVQYLEKLVNIEVPVPPATAVQLGELIASTGPEDKLAQRRRRRQRGLQLAARAAAAAVIVGLFGWVFTAAKQKGIHDLAASRLRTPPIDQSLAVTPAEKNEPPSGAPTRGQRAVAIAGLPGDFVPGESAPTSRTLLAICLLVVVGGGIVSILRRPVVTVHDSRDFTEALNVWSPLVYTRRNTPRGIKKFLNRVRFYAMRQEAHRPTETHWDRVVGWMKRQPGLGAAVRWLLAEPAAKPRQTAPTPGQPVESTIPEHVLVALSSIQECKAEWLEDPKLYENFPDFLKTNAAEPLPQTVQENLDSTRDWGPLTPYRERFKRLSTGLRIG